ncbi:MAG TPA: oligopeptide/dipeptide ABC transporter ATP-binding protein, partial [Acidimicrobiales bacterium]|nr:oligopeptide/dipeptide ABC transporter ATP-binding protein [Acidimicrobiales bacterium]
DAPVPQLLAAPAHPYSAILLAASPDMGIDREQPLPTLDGRVPGPEAELAGCYFAPRCPFADERCHEARPPLEELVDGRRVACWHPFAATNPAGPSAGATSPGATNPGAASHRDGNPAMAAS